MGFVVSMGIGVEKENATGADHSMKAKGRDCPRLSVL
jgi:hypothetical protein